ncbi:MAG: 50S ribosomal protein L21e [Candidatus Hydrothermarchaeaceae archaeon]
MGRSKGFKSGTRYKLKRDIRAKGKLSISKALQKFNPGEKVHIVINSAVQKGMPHPRFHGKTGTVIERRGRAHLVEITENNAKKIVICAPSHLDLQRPAK